MPRRGRASAELDALVESSVAELANVIAVRAPAVLDAAGGQGDHASSADHRRANVSAAP
jgi:CheY-specific phosphatase CheX